VHSESSGEVATHVKTRPPAVRRPNTQGDTSCGTLGILVVVWLVVGAIAAGQRGFFTHASQNCASAGTIAVTVIAGPLNYVGVNPKVTNCNVPQPSS
jgi:membrane protein YdbS with pleckstrin-like domain